jgi:hypothetical protein
MIFLFFFKQTTSISPFWANKKHFHNLTQRKVALKFLIFNFAERSKVKIPIDFEIGFKVNFKSKLYFSRLFLKARFEKILNTNLASNYLLNIYKLFLYSNKHIQVLTSIIIIFNLPKQHTATCMFR